MCDYLDKDLKNELKILVLHFNDSQVGKEETFSGMTISQMNEYLNQIKNLPKSDERFQNVEFIDGGCLKVNGNVVIYAVHKDSSQPVKTIFQYHVAKNRKIYVLFYFTVDSINNKPNDVILTSLNTLRMK